MWVCPPLCVIHGLETVVGRINGGDGILSPRGLEKLFCERVECVSSVAGEVVLNSIDTDGVKRGFDLPMLRAVCDAVQVPVIASGGAGCTQDFIRLFREVPGVDAGLAASIFHFGEVAIEDLKREMMKNGIPARV